ncbi:MAG: type II secretion system protein GspG [Pseudomonadota bacterium]|nr:type II secretion system protein GspG [Pseudomonadota bacterium]
MRLYFVMPVLIALSIDNASAWSTIDTRVVYALSDINAINSAIELACSDHNRCPSTNEGIDFLVEYKYLKKYPVDPWGYKYHYENVEGKYRTFSYGEDNRVGGSGLSYDFDSSTPELNEENLDLVRDEVRIREFIFFFIVLIFFVCIVFAFAWLIKWIVRMFRKANS